MRIGINGRFLVAKRTGVQRAAYNMLTTLVKLDRSNEYFIFTGRGQLGRPEWNYDNVHVIASDLREGESIRNHFWEQLTLPRLARKHHIDVLHSPANIAPLFYSGDSVVHIHDLCFVVNPQWYSFSFRTLYNLIIPRLARKATKVITNSNNSKNDLLHYFKLSADRVSLVYWAVDDTFSPRKNSAPPLSETPLLQDPSAAESFILYVGSLEPRKNIGTLIEAYELFRQENPDLKTKLVLIGGESPLFAEVRLRIKKYRDDVIFKGFVDDLLLSAFYRDALVVVYPSLYEGFGLPPLEAMASGTPVITTMTSSLPEVVGGAAILVNPLDIKELASAINRVCRDKSLREDMRAKGIEQVKKFNWARVARNTLAVYYEVFLGRRKSIGGNSHLPFDKWRELVKLEVQESQRVQLSSQSVEYQ